MRLFSIQTDVFLFAQQQSYDAANSCHSRLPEKGGLLGAAIATTAVVLPAFFIILLIMVVMKRFLQNKYVEAALVGLKTCIIGIILVTGLGMILKNCGLVFGASPDVLTKVLTCLIALVYWGSGKIRKQGINPIMLICLSAVAGVVAYGL